MAKRDELTEEVRGATMLSLPIRKGPCALAWAFDTLDGQQMIRQTCPGAHCESSLLFNFVLSRPRAISAARQ